MFFKQDQLKIQTIDDNSYREVLAHEGKLMNVKVFFKHATPNDEIPVHNHVHEQTTYVLKGSFKFEIRGENGPDVQEVHQGDSIYFPSNVYHGCIPLEDDSQLLDSFTPQREDFLK
ncbi:cupin domain-containing protein [Paucilactobacillus suebicus]|uniref:Pectin degradation protein (Sugar phosphate isomerase family) n=1 Tax=Paucilactobacillus suebicus DSM 5007 = KCTC 3549 TaxID=1423807 RepID=A0A0R1W3A8_9LACO|nr:cupin domain-containing protein [Paucilactobacillus suebicus]KRM12138.1 pectin degradation protein (sugar phosphate isomerase family) [Paucilactobacillus suebicus DSM 5007 = KCTC 3549]